ncbi:MAG: acetolactate synthase large subunit, partial [Boseongicola sp. SB0677_bin_26]|nr:acetolactate synthase large subunit [Boseongicola sp. SB0677_bin_26]
MNGGEAIVEMLRRFDVDTMFGLPGEQTHIHDAIFRRNDIRHLLVRHEQAAAKMADSHARATGKVGVCDATVGPGATNLISGI